MEARHAIAYAIIFLFAAVLIAVPLYLRRQKRQRRRSGNRGRIDIIAPDE
jgi:hypothetical protein